MATEFNYYDGLNLERMAILEEEMSMQGTLEDTYRNCCKDKLVIPEQVSQEYNLEWRNTKKHTVQVLFKSRTTN